jgi:hypothetical protein
LFPTRQGQLHRRLADPSVSTQVPWSHRVTWRHKATIPQLGCQVQAFSSLAPNGDRQSQGCFYSRESIHESQISRCAPPIFAAAIVSLKAILRGYIGVGEWAYEDGGFRGAQAGGVMQLWWAVNYTRNLLFWQACTSSVEFERPKIRREAWYNWVSSIHPLNFSVEKKRWATDAHPDSSTRLGLSRERLLQLWKTQSKSKTSPWQSTLDFLTLSFGFCEWKRERFAVPRRLWCFQLCDESCYRKSMIGVGNA